MKTVTELMTLLSNLPPKAIDRLFSIAQNLQDDQPAQRMPCPYCGEVHTIRYGKKCGKQRFLCKCCNRTFVTTTHTIMSHSRQDEETWRSVIADTAYGRSIDFTAQMLSLSHQCVFDMRHKILVALQDNSDVTLGGVTELDETYVLDSYKGVKFNENSQRNPRKHGAVAEKRGLSQEYICICTGVERKGSAYACAVNRAKPSKQELQQALSEHIERGSLLLCDGLRGYSTLGEKTGCAVRDINTAGDSECGFFNLNSANNFHSFIKHRYEAYRGVATKYLNRYSALFSAAYKAGRAEISNLCDTFMSCGRKDYFHPIRQVRSELLLVL